MHRSLEREVVVIVGGSSGMGLAAAGRCLAAGAAVTIVGRDEARLEAARKALGGSSRLAALPADLSSEAQVRSLFARFDEVHHVVSTAADIRGAYEHLPDLKLEAVERAVGSKLTGPILLAKHAAPKLRPGGSITFTSGIAAYRPSPRGAVVAAINAGLEGLVRALAVELAPIRVNAVSPGWVRSPIWADVAGDRTDEILNAMAARLPVGRVGEPADIADAIAFLIGNAFTTGTVLHVEGGHRLI
ncbi:SDR family oxidoreductase [Caulobacter sp. UNC358MFTsu5.1]|uniref:SDR family oxidoreductase n=1 Tax=Caulobacter sp. UNC358MFTsu5.1 TaxID=1449049 RepID=UPI0004A6C3C5|nr:SDR family oxidoreductase [Caulobacter sp. UNC358MFTsu5.1]